MSRHLHIPIQVGLASGYASLPSAASTPKSPGSAPRGTALSHAPFCDPAAPRPAARCAVTPMAIPTPRLTAAIPSAIPIAHPANAGPALPCRRIPMHRLIRIRATTRERPSRQWRPIRPIAARIVRTVRVARARTGPAARAATDPAVPAGQMAAARMDAAARARLEPANRGTVRPIARTANARRVATAISAVRKMIRFRRGTRGPIIPRRPRDIRRRTGRTHRLLAAATIRVRPTGTTETATTNWRARSTTNAT